MEHSHPLINLLMNPSHDQALEDIGVRDAALRDNYHQIMKTPVDDWAPRNFLTQKYVPPPCRCVHVYMHPRAHM
jgi:hypothetical protein